MSLITPSARAQNQTTDSDSARVLSSDGFLTIHSSIAGIKVFLDSQSIGEVPIERRPVSAGLHILRTIHPSALRWPTPVMVETLLLPSAASVERTIEFPDVYYISSDPYGATVVYGDSIVGTTPLYFSANAPARFLTLRKDGFEEAVMMLPSQGGSMYTNLHQKAGSGYRDSPLMVSGEQTKSLVPILLVSGTAIMAGRTAAYFKIQADKKYDEYRSTGNPAALDHVHELDTYSAVALVTCQLSIIALSYILFSP